MAASAQPKDPGLATVITTTSPTTFASSPLASFPTIMSAVRAARWAALHANPTGPGDARPTALSIVRDEQLVNQWADKVVLVTGASGGIGLETVRALHATGAHLFLPVRDVKRVEAVVQDLLAASEGKGRIDLLQLDLTSLSSVRQCAAEFLQRSQRLHVLILNAAVMATPEGRTADGFETQFGVNHVAHFLLFQLLKPALLASSTPHFQSRVVCLSSTAHGQSPVLFDDYDLKKRGYEPWTAYGQAKTANIYLATEIERRYGSRGLHANAVHPGSVKSGLQVHVREFTEKFYASYPKLQARTKSAEQGAATTVWAAVSAEWEGKGGRYLEDCAVATPRMAETGLYKGFAAWAFDEEAAKRLWEETLRMVGLSDDEHLNS